MVVWAREQRRRKEKGFQESGTFQGAPRALKVPDALRQ